MSPRKKDESLRHQRKIFIEVNANTFLEVVHLYSAKEFRVTAKESHIKIFYVFKLIIKINNFEHSRSNIPTTFRTKIDKIE